MIVIVILYIIAHLISFGIGFCSNSYEGCYPFILPRHIYKAHRVNWFGAIFIYTVYLVSTPLWAIGTLFWWLCTVGRK